jgi:hypothetical protein
MTSTKWTSCAVEEPAPSEAEGTPYPPEAAQAKQGISTRARVERTLLSAAFAFSF